MRPILIVGGAGYIGSHVAQELEQAGYQIVIFDNFSSGTPGNLQPSWQLIEGDIMNLEDLRKALVQPFEAVFHFAALKAAGESMIQPGRYARRNIGGTLNLLTAMAEAGVQKLIFASTAVVYEDPKILPIVESTPLAPTNFYGFTKLEVERVLPWFEKLHGIRHVVFRFFNAAGYGVGPFQREQGTANLIPLVMEVACGLREKLLVFGKDYPTPDGTGKRDYIHPSDIARANHLGLNWLNQNPGSLILNLGSGQAYSVLEIIQMAEEVTGQAIPYQIVERRPGDVAELRACSAKAARELGWQAQESDLRWILESAWRVYQPLRTRQ